MKSIFEFFQKKTKPESEKKQKQPTDINSMPAEILREILANLTPEELCKISPVCKTLNKLSNEDSFWDGFLKNELKMSVKEIENSKKGAESETKKTSKAIYFEIKTIKKKIEEYSKTIQVKLVDTNPYLDAFFPTANYITPTIATNDILKKYLRDQAEFESKQINISKGLENFAFQPNNAFLKSKIDNDIFKEYRRDANKTKSKKDENKEQDKENQNWLHQSF